MKKLFVSIIIFSIIYACSNNKGKQKITENVQVFDSIKPDVKISSAICYEKSLKYHNRFNYLISDFYDISDFSIKDLDNDNNSDTIAILSPLNLTPGDNCKVIGSSNRLIIFSFANGKKYKYSNIITNELGMGSLGSELIKFANNKLVLEREIGQSCVFKYQIYTNYHNNKFKIDSICLTLSGCPYQLKKEKSFNYSEGNFYLEDYNRSLIDSLRIISEIDNG